MHKQWLKRFILALIVLSVFITASVTATAGETDFAFTRAPVTPTMGGPGPAMSGVDLQVDYLTRNFDSLDGSISSVGISPILLVVAENFGFTYRPSFGFMWSSIDTFDSFWGINMGIIDMSMGGIILGEADSTNLILFGGGKFNVSILGWEAVGTESLMVNLLYGFNGGLKTYIALAHKLTLVPFYILDLTSGLYHMEIGTTSMDDTLPWNTMHVFGLDILIGGYSLGAMLDIGDDDGYTFSLNFRIKLHRDTWMKTAPAE